MSTQSAPSRLLADRVDWLGTETVFAVAAEAVACASRGMKVYPFHLGDLNIATPENITEATVKAMHDRKTGYCPTAGIPGLREALAADINRSHGLSYDSQNIAMQPGGKPVIAKFLLALMNPGDEVLYPNPGFPIYESLIGFLGGVPVPYGYVEKADHFALDMERLEAQIRPRTRLLILNDLHNPTSAECTPDELEQIADLVLRHDLHVLCDEAYFDVRYGGESRSLASLPGMVDRCILLYTFSKKYAMTGWRIGAAIGPKDIVDVIATLNVNCESCTNQFVQWGALEALTGDQSGSRHIMDTLRDRRDAGWHLLNSIDGVHCLRPNATFYLYPRVTVAAARKGLGDHESLREAVLEETGVSMCTRQHFGSALPHEKDLYLRLAFSGIDTADMVEGLERLKTYLES
jgi:aspartate/methionine/tyrosine aminotransferase